MSILLFALGTFVGSFLGVAADRYREDGWVFQDTIYGRSRCDSCRKELGFFDLIPLLSFLAGGGRCRFCKSWLGWRYPMYEILTGLIVSGVYAVTVQQGALVSGLWILLFLILFLIALIDLRTTIIPDELNVVVFLIGLGLTLFTWEGFGLVEGSFVHQYAALFGFRDSLFVNRLIGILVPTSLYLFLLIITRGRGMGGGDVKLSIALGMAFGWPDALLITMLAFVVGSIVVAPSLFMRKKKRKDLVPFGPFIVVATFMIFFWGEQLLSFYFSLIPIIV